jgi:hypothetical protein
VGTTTRISYVDGTTYVAPDGHRDELLLDRQSLLFVAGFVGDAVVVAGWHDPVRLLPEHGPVTVVPHLRHAVDTHGTLVPDTG